MLTCKVTVLKLAIFGVITPLENSKFPRLFVYIVPELELISVYPVLVVGVGPSAG